MNLRRKGSLVGRAALVVGMAACFVVGWSKVGGMADREALKNTNLTSIRQQALTMFPRGSRVDDLTGHLVAIGFDCEPLPRFLPDTSAPALLCASEGRGYPDFPAVNLTVMTRNGLVTDIEVWNVMARADSELDDVDMTPTGSIPEASSGDGDAEPSSAP